MKIEISGKITIASEYDEIMIGGIVVSEFVDNLGLDYAKLTYYISNEEIDSTNAVEKMLLSYYEGKCETDSSYCCGSSLTGVYGRNDEFKIDGHDIIKELTDKIGKYCYIKIETK